MYECMGECKRERDRARARDRARERERERERVSLCSYGVMYHCGKAVGRFGEGVAW